MISVKHGAVDRVASSEIAVVYLHVLTWARMPGASLALWQAPTSGALWLQTNSPCTCQTLSSQSV